MFFRRSVSNTNTLGRKFLLGVVWRFDRRYPRAGTERAWSEFPRFLDKHMSRQHKARRVNQSRMPIPNILARQLNPKQFAKCATDPRHWVFKRYWVLWANQRASKSCDFSPLWLRMGLCKWANRWNDSFLNLNKRNLSFKSVYKCL